MIKLAAKLVKYIEISTNLYIIGRLGRSPNALITKNMRVFFLSDICVYIHNLKINCSLIAEVEEFGKLAKDKL